MSLRKEMEGTPVVGEVDGPVPGCAVNHPSWPEEIYVRQMSVPERKKYDAYGYKLLGGKELEEDGVDVETLWGLKPYLVCKFACDKQGNRLFDDGDDGWIEATLPGHVVVAIAEAAAEFNKLTPSSLKEATKNSESGKPTDS